MTDRPILYSGPMVRALLDGRKTMTRRRAWRQQEDPADSLLTITVATPWQSVRPGSRLWVREGYTNSPVWWHGGPTSLVYAADWPDDERRKVKGTHGVVWHPSIYMPRAFSRLTLTVTAVKVERLQEITEEDALAEGVSPLRDGFWTAEEPATHTHAGTTPRAAFAMLWNRLHGPGAWDADPGVVALTFAVAKVNIDAKAEV